MRPPIARWESAQIQQLGFKSSQEVAAWTQRLADLNDAEQRERAACRTACIRKRLQRERFDDVPLNGIGDSLKQRLRHYGIISADDVSQQRLSQVPGIGPQRRDTLLSWRQRTERRISAEVPQLSRDEEEEIEQQFSARKLVLTVKLTDARNEETTALRRLRAEVATQVGELDRKQIELLREHDRGVYVIRERHQERRMQLEAQIQSVKGPVEQKRKSIQEQIDATQREVFRDQLKSSEAQRELKRYRYISFAHYLGQIVGLKP